MGAFRYAPISNNSTKFNRVQSIKKRIDLYEKTGNMELLVDIANICMVEFIKKDHPLAHFDSVDDGEHVSKH